MALSIHAAALAVPAFAAANYPGLPAWRPGVFIAVNATAAVLFLVRPRWFTWAFAVLTAQQIYSHGGSAWMSWQRDGQVRSIDAAALVAIPLALVLLVVERRKGPPLM